MSACEASTEEKRDRSIRIPSLRLKSLPWPVFTGKDEHLPILPLPNRTYDVALTIQCLLHQQIIIKYRYVSLTSLDFTKVFDSVRHNTLAEN